MADRLTREEEREIVNAEKGQAKARRRETQAEKKRPKQPRLPGTEDAHLGKLEELATDFYEAGKRRAQLKLDILDEMKNLKKKHYKCDGLEVTIVDGTESVRVKVEREDQAETDE